MSVIETQMHAPLRDPGQHEQRGAAAPEGFQGAYIPFEQPNLDFRPAFHERIDERAEFVGPLRVSVVGIQSDAEIEIPANQEDGSFGTEYGGFERHEVVRRVDADRETPGCRLPPARLAGPENGARRFCSAGWAVSGRAHVPQFGQR
ncbi:MAG: hypothetical protein M3N38_07450 [Pseudomonadota bacterium]|nr:hypothetical protein [Pseudomonadota bacterium]